MRKAINILFFLLLAADMLCISMGEQEARYFTKPLLMILLAAYMVSSLRLFSSPLKKWLLFALLFSWVGDILLIFETHDKLFFLLGLSSFLFAHIFYSVFFHKVRIVENIRGRLIVVVPVAIYYGILIYLLSPHLGEMGLPVKIYGVVISLMLMLAWHAGFMANRIAGLAMATGAFFFVVSDSILAFNKFHSPIPLAGIWVMLTYGLAQFLIIYGSVKYISEAGPTVEQATGGTNETI